jgi:hypothetical protein
MNNWSGGASIEQNDLQFNVMKTKFLTATTLALMAASSAHHAYAGDREWATAGKVLTGIAAASIISHAFEPRPVVYAAPPTVVYQTVPTTTTYVTSQPVATTTAVQVTAQIPNAPTVPVAPTIGTQTVIVQQPATVVYQQPAVIYAPAPVVYAPAPYYYGPRVGFGIVIGGGHYHHRRW